MKKIWLMAALMCATAATMAQTEVKGKIEKVTVYPNSALVEKSITTYLQKGENKFVITGNATTVGTEDIHFSASPDWFISSMRSEQGSLPAKELLARELPQAAYAQYVALKAQQDDLQLKIGNANILVAMLNQQAAALNNMKALRNTAAFDTIVNLKAQFDYQRKESQAINASRAKAQQEIEEMTTRLRQVERDMDQLLKKHTGGRKVMRNQNDIYVTVYSNKNVQNAKIGYSYLTGQVSSTYSYDVMLDEDKHQAVFSLKSSVSQNTGEHWNGCPLVFSTSEAGYAGYDRALYPYYLDYVQEQAVGARPQVMMAKMARNTAVAEEPASMDAMAGYVGSRTLNDISVVGEQTLTREYVLQGLQTVPSGEVPQTMMLHNDTTKAIFARYATPKIEEKVHFTALLPEWEQLGLLDRSCNVYLNNRYVSVSNVVTSGSGDTMRFAVGQDPNVLVGRKMVKSSPDKSGMLSKEITETATITLTLKNTKNEAVEVNVKDQIPISNASDLKVTDVRTDGGVLDEKTGIVRWKVALQPREQKVVTLTYSVKYPKDKERSVILR